MKKVIFLIEKLWLDPMENNSSKAAKYEPYRYAENIKDAAEFCKNGRIFTSKDCWTINDRETLPEFRIKTIRPI